MSVRDQIHCVCPDSHNYLDTKYDFSMEGADTVIRIEYFCLPVCIQCCMQ